MKNILLKFLLFFTSLIGFQLANARSLQIQFIGKTSPITIKIFSYKDCEEKLFVEQMLDSNNLFEYEINNFEECVFRLVIVLPNKFYSQDILWIKEDKKLTFSIYFQNNNLTKIESNSNVNSLWINYLENDLYFKTKLIDLNNFIEKSNTRNESNLIDKMEQLKSELKSLKKSYLQKSSNPLYQLMVSCSGANVDVSISYSLHKISKEALFDEFSKDKDILDNTPLYIDFFSSFTIYLDQQYYNLNPQDRKIKIQENLDQLLDELKLHPKQKKYFSKMVLEYKNTQ